MPARVLEPEFLDALPANSPDAVRSRADLRRVNRWMRNERHLVAVIRGLCQAPTKILEVGSGDGTFILSLARRLNWKHPVRLTMLDMQPVVSNATLEGLHALGWQTEVRAQTLQDWLDSNRAASIDLVLGNLFWHHLSDQELKDSFASISRICRAFLACEPRRWAPAQIATRLLWAIGCSKITRHDARVSVNAGFRDQELSALWPADSGMRFREYSGGWASHMFVAENHKKTPIQYELRE
jgi:hypothetical protein